MKLIVSKIEIQKRNKDRVNIFVNDEFAFACSAELVYYHGLKKGVELDKNKIEDVVEADNYIKAKNAALKILERSYKTENEILKKLLEKKYNEKTIARVMAFLKEYSFVDDERYAKLYIKEKSKSIGKGKIKYALINKGIDEELIENNLNNISSDYEEQVAFKLAEKKFNILIKSEKNSMKLKRKLCDYLIRNGYNYDIANRIINKIVVVEEYEEKQSDEVNYEELCNLATKRLKVLKKSENDKTKLYKKIHDYLLRRGYKYDEIKSVLKEIL